MTISAFPLHWPVGWKRTLGSARRVARFGKRAQGVSIAEAVGRVQAELGRLGAKDTVISTDLELRRDGLPYSNQPKPADPGAAVYWRVGDVHRSIAIDCYDRIADNLAAIAATLEALRAVERHGGAEILDRAFTGFDALPPPAGGAWWEVLGVMPNARPTEIKAAYQRMRSVAHPDNGGTCERFDAVQRAYELSPAGGAQ